MPLSNDTSTRTRKVLFDAKSKSTARGSVPEENQFLTIAAALPILPGAPVPPKLSKRCYNSFSCTGTQFEIENAEAEGCNVVTLQWTGETRTIVASRTPAEREKNPDRICLDRRGNNIKTIGCNDFQGLTSLKELNLRRNKLKRLLGFDETPQLQKLYLSNNDIHKIEDMSSLAKALQIKEITIDGNPVTLNTDYISFLVSYLPSLQLLSTMQISEQIRRTAMAWRFSKEQSNSTFLDLSTQVCMSVRREEVISNAKTNWEFLRTKVSLDNSNKVASNNAGNNNINILLRTQSSNKFNAINPKSLDKAKIKGFGSLTSINENMEARKIHIKKRSSSSENLFKLEDTSKSYLLEFKLPPILGSIVNNLTSNRFDNRLSKNNKENDCKMKVLSEHIENISDSETDSSQSHGSLKSGLKCHLFTPNIYGSAIDYDKSIVCNEFTVAKDVSSITAANFYINDNENHAHDKEALAATSKNSLKCHDAVRNENTGLNNRLFQNTKIFHAQDGQNDYQPKSIISSSGYCSLSSKTSSVDSCKSLLSDSSISSVTKNTHRSHENDKDHKNRIKSAQTKKIVYYKSNRAATARAKFRTLAPSSPPLQQVPPKEREQGGDYLIEIVGRCLNIYGQGALRFIDRTWDVSKAQDVNIVKFNYVQFNDVAKILSKLKNRFPHAEHFVFKETNINLLGQLNALAEVQGLTSIEIDAGNPIVSKDWKMYAIFRLAHWGLAVINGKEITAEDVELANQEYTGLIDIVMCSLPDSLLQPLLQRLHLEKVQKQSGEQITAKQFLFNCDPALRSVVAKEALQWRKGNVTQEDLIWRHKGKVHLLNLINFTINAIRKLQILEKQWPCVLYEIVSNTLSDFSEIDMYMKHRSKMLESNK
ncbi:Leucine-rich repeat-containing protein 49 [Trachymyrmex zeteki]|uniref:Leucine-rich repeat-containing protein 49 n=1 Tax=Mycetomoellerius zeteki TaxID=64791 RepID=A0A151WN16_9HYME|nr:Leucine-rich repeat-containing protein 49 [Trachymyrmex zeteki]